MPAPGRRLTPDQRRHELVDVGAEMFARQPYEDVLMEDVATRAGVSRALMYHYFPAKRDFFAAIFKRDSERLLAASEIDPGLPMGEQVLAGLNAHLDYFEAHKYNILTANRGALAGDPLVQAIISDELATLHNRILDATGLHGHDFSWPRWRCTAGWLSFVRSVSNGCRMVKLRERNCATCVFTPWPAFSPGVSTSISRPLRRRGTHRATGVAR
jgi:AcrR family transcriptional regulator